jgi:hypothetical protein
MLWERSQTLNGNIEDIPVGRSPIQCRGPASRRSGDGCLLRRSGRGRGRSAIMRVGPTSPWRKTGGLSSTNARPARPASDGCTATTPCAASPNSDSSPPSTTTTASDRPRLRWPRPQIPQGLRPRCGFRTPWFTFSSEEVTFAYRGSPPATTSATSAATSTAPKTPAGSRTTPWPTNTTNRCG